MSRNVVSSKSLTISFLVLITLLFAVAFAFGTTDLPESSEKTLIRQENKIFLSQLADTRLLLTSNSIFDTSKDFSLASNLSPVTTSVVTNLNDSGLGSLRQAITDANNIPGDDIINFQNGLTGIITLTSGELVINSNITINGIDADVISVSGNSQSRVFNIEANSVVSINNLTITQGFVPQGPEGGVCGFGLLNAGNLNVANSKIINNSTTGNTGCGLGFSNIGTMVLFNSSVSGNTSRPTLGPSIMGGGIRNSGTLTITNSTISSNIGRAGSGINNDGTLIITNSTLYGNRGECSTCHGGAIEQQGGSLVLSNSTIANNAASYAGGIDIGSGNATLYNTIVANNTVSTPSTGTLSDVNGTVTSQGNNLISSSSGSSGWISSDLLNVNAQLTSLGNYGGPTQTVALLSNSPAINAGNNANAPPTDQRGFARIVGGTIDIGAYEFPVACTYSINSTSQQFDASGGNTTVNVTTPPGCSWTAVSNDSWISVTNGSSGNGNGTVSLTVQANTGIARTGTVTIAGQTFTVTQASGCAYSLTPTNTNVSASGGSSNFSINSGTGCPWTAASNAPWITVTSGSSGTGSGTVSFSVPANNGIARTGTISAGGQTFTVNQANGCAYSLSQISANVAATGGNFNVNVSAGEGCAWSALSNVPWIVGFTSGNTIGNGTVTFSVQANTGQARTGTITIAGQTFTVTQSTGCTYSLSSTGTAFPAAGGSGSFNVTANNGCAWTAVSDSSWLTINSVSSGNGNGAVSFSVQANVGPERTGTITVNGQTFTVTQANGCAFTISATSLNVGKSAGTGSFQINSGAECVSTAASNNSWITITGSNTFFGSGTVNFSFTANTGQARTGTITAGGQTFSISQASGITNTHTAFDFDGDGKADISVYRPSDGVWYLLNSSSGFTGAQFGVSTDKIIPADYDGDGKTDFAVTRVINKSLIWYLQRSSQGFLGGIEFGQADDIPVPADYDGDGKADIAVFRPSNGGWYILGSRVGFYAIQFGQVGDVPVPADYDGDGKADVAVYRPSQGMWYIQRSQLGFTAFQFGAATDKPVPADYDGDGKADLAVYRPSNGTWYLQLSTAGFTGVQFGISTDKPVPADYDGDGKADIAVFRDGTWYIQRSTAGFTGVGFGNPTDKPVPNAFIP